jgi:hypothetical protein
MNNQHREKNMLTTSKILLSAAVIATLFLTGCIGQSPEPRVARPGDIVNINLGGFKRNAGGQYISATSFQFPNGSVTITDANSVVHTPDVLGVYRAFPDHTSMFAVQTQSRADANFGSAAEMVPHDGAVWLAIRLTAGIAAKLPLAAGNATISVSSTSQPLTQTSFANDGVHTAIPIYIMQPPAGQEAGFFPVQKQPNYAYSTQGYLTLKPNGGFTEVVGGAQISVDFDCTLTQSDAFQLRLVPLHHNPNVNLIQNVTPSDPSLCPGAGKQGTLTAIVTNPEGFAWDMTQWTQGQGTPKDLQFGIVSDSGSLLIQSNATLGVDFTWGGYYIDMNGNTIAGVTPELSNELF